MLEKRGPSTHHGILPANMEIWIACFVLSVVFLPYTSHEKTGSVGLDDLGSNWFSNSGGLNREVK
jgi:hypothetical protein